MMLFTRYVTLLSAMAVVVCSGCADPHLEHQPSLDRFRGIWVIDPDRTTWRAAKPFLQDGSIGPNRGHLEIRADGTFVVKDLPDFSLFADLGITLHQSGSGTWHTDQHPVYKWSLLFLDYKTVDGKAAPADKTAHLYFVGNQSALFLQAMILDPDTGDVLVLRKATEQP
jgi:hypothetical protein